MRFMYGPAGEDFDNTILHYLVSEFKKDTGIDLSKDRLAVQRLREVREGELLLGCYKSCGLPVCILGYHHSWMSWGVTGVA
jgi:hypothetical protein